MAPRKLSREAKRKHEILLQYEPHVPGCSFQDPADTYTVKGGRRTVERWFKDWDGTPQSLERKAGSGRKPQLTIAQKKKCIRDFVEARHRAGEHVSWKDVQENVYVHTRYKLSEATIGKIGRTEFGISSKTTSEVLTREGSEKFKLLDVGAFMKLASRFYCDAHILIFDHRNKRIQAVGGQIPKQSTTSAQAEAGVHRCYGHQAQRASTPWSGTKGQEGTCEEKAR